MKRIYNYFGFAIIALLLGMAGASLVTAASDHYNFEQGIANGNFSASDTIERIAIAAGMHSGVETIDRFGFNTQIDAGAVETIWMAGGSYVWATAAETLTVVSSSAADDKDAGTGAQYITVTGLDDSYNEISEIIAMEGATPRLDQLYSFGLIALAFQQRARAG